MTNVKNDGCEITGPFSAHRGYTGAAVKADLKGKEEQMKRLLVVMMAVFFLSGCGAAARESGFYEHNTLYKNWEHLKFSVYGYDKVDQKEAQMSKEQSWWGLTVERSE
jgi:uncharacterized lipoprotein YajG